MVAVDLHKNVSCWQVVLISFFRPKQQKSKNCLASILRVLRHLHFPIGRKIWERKDIGCVDYEEVLANTQRIASMNSSIFFIPLCTSPWRDVNTAIMELLIMAYALKTSCAKNIIGVIPYFPYSKQCKMRKRGSIVCKLLASMLAKAGSYISPCLSVDISKKTL